MQIRKVFARKSAWCYYNRVGIKTKNIITMLVNMTLIWTKKKNWEQLKYGRINYGISQVVDDTGEIYPYVYT